MKNMEFRFISTDDAAFIADFYLRNAEHLDRWEPLRDKGFHSAEAWLLRLQARAIEFAEGKSAHFVCFNPMEMDILAICSLTNIVRGPLWLVTWDMPCRRGIKGRG